MIIKTRDFDELEINESDIIHFPNGIYAFEDQKSFVLIHYPDQDVAPMWLQSVDDPSLCFIVFDPILYVEEYSPNISAADMNALKAEKKDDIRYLAISVIGKDVKDSTLNLKSPIVININNNYAVQSILEDDYPIRFPLFSDEKGA